ncbi:hypothetical protein Btru_016171 [Bulinus truncatus]|nr:hypothetical protein Btru_016171 [Bulinus truncatus]
MNRSAVFVCAAVFVVLFVPCQASEGYFPLLHKCNFQCPHIYNPVCASNGVTYRNLCYFQVANCKRPLLDKLWIICYGPCPSY